MDETAVLEKTKELAELIAEDARCERLRIARVKNNEDKALQALIGEFNLKKLQMKNEFDKEPPDKQKIEAFEQDMKKVYGDIMANKSMAEYNEAKKAVDAMLEHISQMIQMSVNGEIGSGCSGNCAGCRGCEE